MPGVSNARHSEEWHDTKGIQLRKNGCQNVTLGWNKVAERIDTLIRNGRYTRLKEQKTRGRDSVSAGYGRLPES